MGVTGRKSRRPFIATERRAPPIGGKEVRAHTGRKTAICVFFFRLLSKACRKSSWSAWIWSIRGPFCPSRSFSRFFGGIFARSSVHDKLPPAVTPTSLSWSRESCDATTTTPAPRENCGAPAATTATGASSRGAPCIS